MLRVSPIAVGVPQTIEPLDPIAIEAGAVARAKLTLAGFRINLARNESLIRLRDREWRDVSVTSYQYGRVVKTLRRESTAPLRYKVCSRTFDPVRVDPGRVSHNLVISSCRLLGYIKLRPIWNSPTSNQNLHKLNRNFHCFLHDVCPSQLATGNKFLSVLVDFAGMH